MRVLIVKTSSLGDVVHCLPAVTDALKAIPNLQIDWLVEEGFLEIPQWHKGVQSVIEVAVRRWRKAPFSRENRQEIKQLKQQLRQNCYDLVIDAQGLLKSAWLARWAKAPIYGYDRNSIREPLASFFYAKKFTISKQLHAVERIRILFSKALNYSLPAGKDLDYGLAKSPQSSENSSFVIFSHSTTWESKHLPESMWIELARHFKTRQTEVRLPWVNDQEKARAQRIIDAAGHGELLPKMNLTDLSQVIANAKAVISVDTGIAHITSALDVPLVVLFGSTDPGLVRPIGKKVHVLKADFECSPCYKRQCQLNITNQTVYPPCYQTISLNEVVEEVH